MAIDTFTIKPEKLDQFDMFRFEGFEDTQSVFFKLYDSYEEAYIEGTENGGTLTEVEGSAPMPEDFDPEFIEYQALCGSWDCRSPECKPKGI
jgi:hypothetical protein